MRRFDRAIDVDWRRTSYSALIRAAEETGGVTSEPELSVRDDEVADELADEPDDAEPLAAADEPAALASPMADLPSGAAFGSLVHGVLEVADPFAPDLEAELRGHVEEQRAWWPVDAPVGGAGRRAGAAAPHLARSAGRRADPRRDRAPRPALRARLRDPAGRW